MDLGLADGGFFPAAVVLQPNRTPFTHGGFGGTRRHPRPGFAFARLGIQPPLRVPLQLEPAQVLFLVAVPVPGAVTTVGCLLDAAHGHMVTGEVAERGYRDLVVSTCP